MNADHKDERSETERSEDERSEEEKKDILFKLHLLAKEGYRCRRNYDMTNSLEKLRCELTLAVDEMNQKNEDAIFNDFVKMLELCNSKEMAECALLAIAQYATSMERITRISNSQQVNDLLENITKICSGNTCDNNDSITFWPSGLCKHCYPDNPPRFEYEFRTHMYNWPNKPLNGPQIIPMTMKPAHNRPTGYLNLRLPNLLLLRELSLLKDSSPTTDDVQLKK